MELNSYSELCNTLQSVKRVDFSGMVLAVLSLILAYWENELFYGDEKHQEKPINTFLRVFIGTISVGLCIIVLYRHKLNSRLQWANQGIQSRKSGWALELIYCSIHTPPGCNWVFEFPQHSEKVEYSLDALVFLAMLGKVYWIWRVLLNFSSWKDIDSERFCNNYLCRGGDNFALKAELKERPYFVVGVALVVSTLILGVALRVSERPYMETSGMQWDYLWNGVWCILITMTTVGFGDFYPSTHLGRFIGVLASFWGTFLVSLMVLSLTISSEFTSKERNAYDKVKKDHDHAQLRTKAANTIKWAVKLRVLLKKNSQKAKDVKKFKNYLIEYRNHKRKLIAGEQDAPVEYILAKLNEKVSVGMEQLKNNCKVYKTILKKLEDAELNQLLIEEGLKKL